MNFWKAAAANGVGTLSAAVIILIVGKLISAIDVTWRSVFGTAGVLVISLVIAILIQLWVSFSGDRTS